MNGELAKNETKIVCESSPVANSSEVNYDIDMTEYAHPEALKLRENYSYRLVATVNHSGTAGSGHYTAICKRPVDHNREKWF